MKLTNKGIAVLDDDNDRFLSRFVERDGRLDDPYVDHIFSKYINKGDIVVDGGAAIGDHTIAYIRASGSPENIHAFEPHPLMLECLKHNCPECCIHPIGLSDEFGTAYLCHDRVNAGGSYVTREAQGNILISVGTLDNCFADNSRLDFIKLDIEGYECKAIKGSSETLRRLKPKIMMEVNPWMLARAGNSIGELFKTLESIGYAWRLDSGNEPNLHNPESTAEYFCYPK